MSISITLGQVALTLGIAVVTALIQMFIKEQSRPHPAGQNHSFTRDDGVFWVDWTVAGGVTLTLSTIGAAANEQSGSFVIYPVLGFVVLVLLWISLPCLIRWLAYEPGESRLRGGGWKDLKWVLRLNTVGLLGLFLAVVMGSNTYA